MPQTLRAAEFVKSDGSVVGSAEEIAMAAVLALGRAGELIIDVRDVRGAPTAFFNVILLRIRDAVGADRLDRDVRFELGSGAQRLVFERSLAAVKAEA